MIFSSVGQFSVFHFRPIGGKRVVFKQGLATFFFFFFHFRVIGEEGSWAEKEILGERVGEG